MDSNLVQCFRTSKMQGREDFQANQIFLKKIFKANFKANIGHV